MAMLDQKNEGKDSRESAEEEEIQKEKERLEQYYQTILKHLPGGVAVVRHDKNGGMFPEFLSNGFAEMVDMDPEEAWKLYQENALTGVHPDDQEYVKEYLNKCISERRERYEMVYRLQKGGSGYIWVKATFSVILSEGGDTRVYVDYHDITMERENAKMLRQQYQEQISQHYLTAGPNVLVLGHCNITQNRILEIDDHTDSGLLEAFGSVREEFFTGISSLIQEKEQQLDFLNAYLNQPSLESFEKGETEVIRKYFIKLPKEKFGRYAQFKVNLVETPDTGDITGFLTVTDVTELEISDQIYHHISVSNYDLVEDVDLLSDTYTIIYGKEMENGHQVRGSHTERLLDLVNNRIIPREREHVAQMLDKDYMRERLQKEESYSFSYSIISDEGDILAKKLLVSAIDMRLGRVCMARTDITDSVKEQQGLLNMLAYTFELACFVDRQSRNLIMYTRDTVLRNLPPHTLTNYDSRVTQFAMEHGQGENLEEIARQFTVDVMLKRLEEEPGGYDFVFPYQGEDGSRYKQINVLWGDEGKKTICLVRADMTDVIEAERQSKEALEKALALAENASRAKSDFLSSMSHDIRTPMNAIMGMTTLALANINDQAKVEDYLQKISASSRHLLSLINDILDMSKIEHSGISLNHSYTSLTELTGQLRSMLEPQARKAGVAFQWCLEKISHDAFYGDSLRVSQILINLLGNAIKFTPEGGMVDLEIEEISSHKGHGWSRYCFTVRDTGIGMSKEFMEHLFEPFTRSKGVTKVEGSGLGLSITKGLVDLMEGTIEVDSTPGHGSTFSVELEFETASEEEKRKAESPEIKESGTLEGRHFLVAEDNEINSEIICELLAMKGAKTVVKKNGFQTVLEFKNTAPGTYDAILMDIQMPIMNGFEASRTIRKMEREDAAQIPIIAMTANAFAEDVQAALEAGMNDHVAKPVDMQRLCDALGRLLPAHEEK